MKISFLGFVPQFAVSHYWVTLLTQHIKKLTNNKSAGKKIEIMVITDAH